MRYTETRESIAAEVRAAVARKQITQQDLAETIGMSRVALSERLRGRRAFNTDDLAALAGALDVDVLEFFASSERTAAVS